ncbi:MAG: hypothetical protein ACYS8K_10185 [Planctomycetota bacterium]
MTDQGAGTSRRITTPRLLALQLGRLKDQDLAHFRHLLNLETVVTDEAITGWTPPYSSHPVHVFILTGPPVFLIGALLLLFPGGNAESS